ncbi:MAG: hypothetical protein ACXVX8_12905 [Blastococcus sp.]
MSEQKKTAGAFDIRNVIAGLIGFYGIVLIVTGIVDRSHAALAKTGGVNANLWSGIVMAVIAGGFVLWSRLRPIVVEEKPDAPADS